MSDLQINDSIWLDVETSDDTERDLADLAAVAQAWLNAYRWSKGEKQRAAYATTSPAFLERVDRRYALAENIVKACS